MPPAFSLDRHNQFAELSGDFNPIHMDKVAARRTQAGAPVVHGVHALLCLLDGLAARDPGLPRARALKAGFRRMIYVGDRAEVAVGQHSASSLRAQLLVDGVEVVGVTVSFAAQRTPAEPAVEGEPAMPPPQRPCDPSLEQMEALKGRLSFATPAVRLAAMFPDATRYLGVERVAALACSSTLVGMVVPGLYSLYGELSIVLQEDCRQAEELAYQVTSVDPRFRMVRVAVRGGGVIGLISAISRPPPTAQADMRAVAQLVSGDEFRGSDALIIGGSRGIGEATAKLVAAGGGRVTLTYRHGAADAEAVAQDIRSWGGDCHVVTYDAQRSAAAQLADLPHAATHVYYFATPTIYKRKAGLFDVSRFEEFNRYYLTGFLELVEACAAMRPEGVRLFYPSTVYVEKRPAEMTEYAMAKAAGEVLCADLAKHLRNVQIITHRLPRVATDQTVSLLPMASASAKDVMLPIVREMHAAQ
jgi:NAD(P)-dependent dehydrogenase (short-subunit alcohol dehydrogenase family)/acyl dehydratase